MKIEQVQRALRAQPFKRFTINMVDGRAFEVKHPEFLVLVPGMERTAILAFPDEEAFEIIDVMHVSSLSIENGKSKRRKKAG